MTRAQTELELRNHQILPRSTKNNIFRVQSEDLSTNINPSLVPFAAAELSGGIASYRSTLRDELLNNGAVEE